MVGGGGGVEIKFSMHTTELCCVVFILPWKKIMDLKIQGTPLIGKELASILHCLGFIYVTGLPSAKTPG